MNTRKNNEFFHVYILVSESDKNLIKIGKANNLNRPRSFSRMGYAGKDDWYQVVSFPMGSDHEAIALESFIIAKLSNQGYKIPRVSWKNLINGKPSYADECFSCSVGHAIEIANEMSGVLQKYL